MPQWFKPCNHSIIGIDLTPSAIKAVQILRTQHSIHVENFAQEALPSNVIIDNHVIDVAAVTASLKMLIDKASLMAKHTVIAVPNSIVIAKVIQINKHVDATELEEFILLEGSKYFSGDEENINLDFVIQGPSLANQANLDVLIIACKAEYIAKRVAAIEGAGLKVKIAELESHAIERALPWLELAPKLGHHTSVIAIINGNLHVLSLYVVENGQTIFNCEETYSLSGLAQTLGQNIPLAKLLTQYISCMLQVYATEHTNVIKHLFLSGEVASLAMLAQNIEQTIGIPTTVASPITIQVAQHISAAAWEQKSASLLLASGLALRCL